MLNVSQRNCSASTASSAATATSALTAGDSATLGGAPPGAFARVGAANSFTADQSITGNLFVGSGTPSGLPLEVQASGQDALTVNSNGNVGLGTGTGTHITTAGSGETDLAGSQISVAAGATASAAKSFAAPFGYLPVCVATPYVAPVGGSIPTSGIPSWYITYTMSQSQYVSFTLHLVSANPNSNPITFNYLCVGNPN